MTDFKGTIGRTLADSEPHFEERPHPGDGAPNVVFVLLDDGISYVRDATIGLVANDPGGRLSAVPVPARLEQLVIDAAEECPGECIFVEDDPVVAAPDVSVD